MISFQTSRCCKSSSSLIDQMFCKIKEPKPHLSSCVIKTCISDHFPIKSVFDILRKKTKNTPKFIKINCSDETSFEAFHNGVKSRIESFDMEQNLFSDPNENWKLNTLHQKTFKNHKHQLSCWMTNGIINSIKFRAKLFLKLTKEI